MATFTTYPTSYNSTTYSYASVNSSYPLSNAIGNNSNSTTYAQWDLKTGSGAESYVFYKFDCSEIPNNATINSVSCIAKGYISTTTSSRISSRTMQMYYGTSTAKGSAVNVSTSATAQTISCGTWTREELNDCNIRIYAKRGSNQTTTARQMRFYGATLSVEYTVPDVGIFLYVQQNGLPQKVTYIYKKINGSWVQQEDLGSLFDTNTKYIKKN